MGPGNAPDTEVLRWAAERGHVVLTADLGFGAILASTQSARPSVVQVRDEVLTTRAIGSSVLAAMRQAREELIKGALISVDAARARMRILPLGE